MTTVLLTFVVTAVVIVFAGIWLTRCADAIADLTGLGRLLVGTVLVAGATSLPELSVDISAVLNNQADLAVGDLLGSCLMNLLILAIVDMSHRQARTAFKRSSLGHALSATLSILLTAIVVFGILVGQRLGATAFLGVGPAIWIGMIVYMAGVRLVYMDQRTSAQVASPPQDVLLPAEGMSLTSAIAGFCVAALVIIISGPFLSHAAAEFASLTGLGSTFVGSTLVAFTTSLPELVASLTAVRMGAFDLAVGNIFGSNAFNIILFLPLDMLQPGSLLASVSPDHAVTGMGIIAVTLVALLGQLYNVERRIQFLEPDAALVIVLVLATLFLIYCLGQAAPH